MVRGFFFISTQIGELGGSIFQKAIREVTSAECHVFLHNCKDKSAIYSHAVGCPQKVCIFFIIGV